MILIFYGLFLFSVFVLVSRFSIVAVAIIIMLLILFVFVCEDLMIGVLVLWTGI